MSRLIVAYHHGDLPAALLAAVESAVADCGVSGVSLRDVARRAGVSHSAPAHHFGSKAGLLTAFATAGYQLLAESVIKEIAAADATDGAVELAAIGRGYVRFAVGHPAHFEVMFRLDSLDPGNAEFVAASEAAYGLLTATVERCRAAGRLHGRSPEVVAVSAWSLVHGLSALWISGRLPERIAEQDPRRLAAAVSDLFIEAVLPPARAADRSWPRGRRWPDQASSPRADLSDAHLACYLTSAVPDQGLCLFVRRVAVTAGGHRDTVGSCPREIGGEGGGRGVQYGVA